MIAGKHISRIVAVMLCVCLITCGLIVYTANAFDTKRITEYQRKLFGDEIITLEIQVDEGDWQNLLDNAQSKAWISGTLIINGERFNAVGIRTKGNSSLSQGRGERYSLQFKFNKYVKGQTYYGLDAFCVNNMMGDATYMKDYLSYAIMQYIGVDTPLTNYAAVTVNGEDYGFGLALERYDEAFLDRVYNTSAGELYSVKIAMGNRGNFEDRWQAVENAFPGRLQTDGRATDGNRSSDNGRNTNRNADRNTVQPGNAQSEGFAAFSQGRGMGGFGFGGNGGGSLVYTGDDPADYSAIFDNAVMGTVSDKDKERVITAIKNLNEGTHLEKYFDVDGILRYFAAHTVVVNLDSYISNMQQNYYIYERDGKIVILPWDYGLAFGGFQSGNASGVVNFPIDTPVSGVSMEERPLLNRLLLVDAYRERYHDYLRQIVEGYFESGLFEDTINALDAKINAYVKNDTTAFYTHEQYEASLPVLIKLGYLRAESIKGQLDGTIPSTSAGQNADNSALIDASSINLSVLGSMMGGGGMGQGAWGGQGGRGANEMFAGMPNELPQGGMGQERMPSEDREPDAFFGGNGNWQGNRTDSAEMFVPPETTVSSGTYAGYAAATGLSLLLLTGATVFVAKPNKNVL